VVFAAQDTSVGTVHIVLIPGFWLDGSSWDEILPALQQVGHHAQPLTLPGMESRDADRSGISLRDHVDAVVAVIDSVDPAAGEVVLVGHSGGGAIAHAAVDARPDRVARVVYVAVGLLVAAASSTMSCRSRTARFRCRIGRTSRRKTSST
jgi:Predicted hydrolases or acyltransferases (alpha/beta hydrolase superfamily)